MTLVDTESRARALTDFGSTLLVQAAAGTGKTSIMAGRVAMLLAGGCPPKDIAAITFTELAASELSHRIRDTIDDLLGGNIPAFLQCALPNGLGAQHKAALAQASRNLDELTATTIHGFCQAIIRSHSVAAGLDPGSRVMNEAAADAMFDGLFSRWLTSRLSGTTAGPDDPIAVLSRENPLGVVELLKKLARLRRKHRTARPVPEPLRERLDVDFTQTVTEFSRWYAAAPGEARTAIVIADLQKLATFYTDALASRPSFSDLWRLAHPQHLGSMRKRNNELEPYRKKTAWKSAHGPTRGEQLNGQAEALFEAANRAYRTLLGAISRALVASVSDAMDALILSFAEQKRAAAVLDFDDLLLHARDLVTGHEDIRQAVGRRYPYILVDEFQDTDPVQTDILFHIAAEARPARWHEAVLRPGALFLVGDPKQAIYRFRGADINVYELARAAVARQPTGAVVEITANFRSQKGIIDHVNACFEPVLSGSAQPGYVRLSATIESAAHGLPCVAKATIPVPFGASAAEQRDAEADTIADICSRLIGSITISRPDGTRSPLQPGDIALLAPSHSELWRYERALEERRISVASQAGKALMLRQETQDLLALVRVLAHPFDTLAFGALMRGPLVGLNEQQLLDITASLPPIEGRESAFFTVLTDPKNVTNPVASSVLITLQQLRRRARVTTPMLLISEAIERLHIRVVLSARHGVRRARALANIDALIERARPYGVAGLQAFVEDLQRDWEGKIPTPEGRSDVAEETIEIVTMHSSKGLEWPVVIPINSGTEFPPPEAFLHRKSDDTLHWVLQGVAPPDLELARDEEGANDARERERTWYVACTRARDLLIIPHLPSPQTGSWARIMDLGQSRLPELDLSHLPATTAKRAVDSRNMQTLGRFEAEAAKIALASPPITWRHPSDHDPDRATASETEVSIVSDVIEVSADAVGAGRLRGILLHKLMEEFLTGELEEDEAATSDRARVLLRQLAPPELHDGPDLPDPTELAATALQSIRLPDVARLRPRLVPEIALWSVDGNDYLAGRADAVAITDDRADAVLDWKSDINPSSHDRQRHVAQLAEYLTVAEAARGAIVYMSLREVVWVSRPT